MTVLTHCLWALLTLLMVTDAALVGDSFFIMGNDLLVATRVDPVVSPGTLSGHVHSIVGGNAFSKDYTFEKSRKSICTTADITEDKSNYWTPQLYRKVDGGFQIAPMKRANIYYFARGQPGEKIYAFPEGYKVLAGSAFRTTFNDTAADNAITYACLGQQIDHTHDFPNINCPGDLRAQVMFPSCWDGVNAFLEGSKHVAYHGKDDACPATHPKRVMTLSYEFSFEDDYPYAEGARVWAMGDITGYGLHADFTMGWPVALLQQAIDDPDCRTGDPGTCPPFAPFLDREAGRGCAFVGEVVQEDIGASQAVAKLPGNNPLWGTGKPKVPDASYVEKGMFGGFGPSVPVGWTKKGCFSDPDGGRALTGASKSDDAMTPEMCTTWCKAEGFNQAGVEWGKECYCGNELAAGSKAVDGQCGNPCPSLADSKGFCGGSRTITLYTQAGGMKRRQRRSVAA